jgi:hypothetical protein
MSSVKMHLSKNKTEVADNSHILNLTELNSLRVPLFQDG